MKRIACIGSITTDIIVKPVNQVPTPGELWAVDSISTHVGGCASNAAIDLAKLGVPSELVCAVGSDQFGSFVRSTCEQNGVGTAGIHICPDVTTTTSMVCVSSAGERSFLYYPGSTSEFTLEHINMDVIKSCDIIFVAGAFLLSRFDGEPCAKLMKAAKEMGKFTVMDTAWDFDDVWLPKIKAVIPHLRLFMPSYDEAVKITGRTEINEIADVLFDLGAETVIIKNGKEGAFICESRECRYQLPTYLSVKPVDTTGAGDSFCAGFLAGLAMDWSYQKSGQFANAVGTHCIMEIGASSGIKPVNEILQFMKEHESEVAIDD